MTPAEIIADARVPGTQSVFFLGCFEQRVTLFSQQVRALNLVDAILDQKLVRAEGKVAIVGGGAAGLTAAVAFAKAAPGLKVIDVYEQLPEVLQLQQSSPRYLHPHNYDWPADGSADAEAGLPILNWRAGPAADVQRHLRRQFDEVERASAIRLKPRTKVVRVHPHTYGQARVDPQHGLSENYEVVILSIGFGLERSIAGQTPSYWSPTGLEAPINFAGAQIFVSGNGDGGLVDFMCAAFNAMSHEAICAMLINLDLGPAKAQLELIEQEAWAPGADLDLRQEYQDRVLPLLPPGVLAEIVDHLRPDVEVRLHTNEPRLFKPNTALLNRLGAFLALAADVNIGRNALKVTTGREFVGNPPMIGPVALEGEAPFEPWRRLLRLGADAETNLAPFEDLAVTTPAALPKVITGLRPATPALTPGAMARFGNFVSVPQGAPAGAPAGAGVAHLRIELVSPGQVRVTGNLAVEELGQVWGDDLALVVDCDASPQDAAVLPPALARLCAHAVSAHVFAADRRRWDEAMRRAATGRAMPGDLAIRFQVDERRPLEASAGGTLMSLEAFVERLHRALDAETFRTLDALLYDILALMPPADCGWIIEPGLRGELWTLWQTWRAALDGDEASRRRFLLLLADERDFVDCPDLELARLGPKTVRPHLGRATLFALAFTVGSGRAVTPSTAHPGNIRDETLSGHACGVSWIEGRVLSRNNVDRAWSAGVVLLAELREAIELLRCDPRLDEDPGTLPRIGDVAVVDRPLILGADTRFLDALEAGAGALSAYFADVLTWRAQLEGAQIEETPP